MTWRNEAVDGVNWRFSPDAAPAEGARLRALARARLIDEITRLPVAADALRITDAALARHAQARIGPDGLIGIAGTPSEMFPRLATQSAPIGMHARVDGYWPVELQAVLAAQPGFPTSFAPTDFGTIDLRRRGVTLGGRTVLRHLPANLPLPGAQVRMEGYWPQAPAPGVSLAASMQPAQAVGLEPGAYAAWSAAQGERCALVADLAHAKTLLLAAAPGATRLRLSNRRALGVGQPLAIDADDAGRIELIGIAAIDTGLEDDQAAWVALQHPLRRLHRPGARIVAQALTSTHDARALARTTGAHDVIAFFNPAPPWAEGTWLRLSDGMSTPEYQRVMRYETVADGSGYWRLPAVARLALVQLRADHPTQTLPLRRVVHLDYRALRHDLDLAFE